MRRSPATTIYLVLTCIFALGALLQPFTFGLGYFGASDGYDLHEVLGGGVLHGIALIGMAFQMHTLARTSPDTPPPA